MSMMTIMYDWYAAKAYVGAMTSSQRTKTSEISLGLSKMVNCRVMLLKGWLQGTSTRARGRRINGPFMAYVITSAGRRPGQTT